MDVWWGSKFRFWRVIKILFISVSPNNKDAYLTFILEPGVPEHKCLKQFLIYNLRNSVALKVNFSPYVKWTAHKYRFELSWQYCMTKHCPCFPRCFSFPIGAKNSGRQPDPKGKYHQLLFRANLTDNLTWNNNDQVIKFQSNEKMKEMKKQRSLTALRFSGFLLNQRNF